MTGDNLTWMTYMRQLIAEYHLNHTFWCFNANSGDTGGLVLDDFVTWDEDKYEFVREVLWQDQDGNFIGLDHAVALGDNGISLSEYSGLDAVPVLSETSESEDTDVTLAGTSSSEAAAEQARSSEATPINLKTADSDMTESTLLKILVLVAVVIVVGIGGFGAYKIGERTARKD